MGRMQQAPPSEHRARQPRRGRRWPPEWLTRWSRLRGWFPILLLGVLLGVVGTLLITDPGNETAPLLPTTSMPPDSSPDVTVTMSPALLTALMRQEVERAESPVPLRDVRVETGGGRLRLLGKITALGQSVGGSIEMEPYVADGQLRVAVRSAKFGRVPVPGNLEQIAERPINARLAAAVNGLPATVTSVTTTDSGLTVMARVRTEELAAP